MQTDWTLADIWERNKGSFQAIVKTILLDHSAVDDVLQDAFTQVMTAAPDLKDELEACNYARRAVINTAINHYRRRKRHEGLIKAVQSFRSTAEERTPLRVLMEKEQRQRELDMVRELQAAMERLTPEQRQALDLVFSRTQRFKEICSETGIPYTTLRSRVLSAVDVIRRHMRARRLLPTDEEVHK
ncbi:MAG TPA: sigma-70 family RNA polymerase sigma factor [Acidobacteriota bacterium]|nr:sigma-70 family RNA polymerase sigma factor [Acidobacteriota bacterium]